MTEKNLILNSKWKKREDTEPVLTNETNTIRNQEINITDMLVDPNEPVYCNFLILYILKF